MTRHKQVDIKPTTVYNRHPETEWGRLRAGDCVKVFNEKGEFRFLDVSIDDDTGNVLWVNLFGPLPLNNRSKSPLLRTVDATRIKIPSQQMLDRQRKAREERGA